MHKFHVCQLSSDSSTNPVCNQRTNIGTLVKHFEMYYTKVNQLSRIMRIKGNPQTVENIWLRHGITGQKFVKFVDQNLVNYKNILQATNPRLCFWVAECLLIGLSMSDNNEKVLRMNFRETAGRRRRLWNTKFDDNLYSA